MLTAGQILWYVPRDSRGKPHEVTVEKIGRKWANLNEYRLRIDIKTLHADGGNHSSPGRCWLSKQDHERHVAMSEAWHKLCDELRAWSPPQGMTVEKIEAIRQML